MILEIKYSSININILMRVDKEVEPTKMRAATVSPKEMKNIRMVKEVGRISFE